MRCFFRLIYRAYLAEGVWPSYVNYEGCDVLAFLARQLQAGGVANFDSASLGFLAFSDGSFRFFLERVQDFFRVA